ncbi:ilvB operon leader peptide IvbL [Affinibrenneria salicis]|uniref:IlvB operon leader peptide IvbL n=1 Tax=Affinibrenneria salicis TaxID=2590031 RepID=A0A5J5G669_9GAMM|nr:ilvB operon leader peptide IvbL [Affinibrenneria salicis]KAA9002621.1 ilvB operon leader peptide IvbL [Affinibrenneria salicis]KAA9003091.1 ilvB operon leader peptide IvbL [Affinibrenneria salicis]
MNHSATLFALRNAALIDAVVVVRVVVVIGCAP